MESLPEELKVYVASFLIRLQDLAHLALASSHLLDSARWNLYRRVILRSNLPSSQDTIALILRSPTLSKGIQAIHIKTDTVQDNQHSASTWIDEDIFQAMDQLRKVAFQGLPCANFQELVASVYSHCPEVNEIVAIDIGQWPSDRPREIVTGLNTQLVVPLSLRRIMFRSDFHPDLKILLPSTCLTQASRLEFLDLSGERITDMLEAISSLCFTDLTTVKITGFDARSSRTLIKFLSSNPSIQAASFMKSETLIVHDKSTKILPKLRSVSGTPHFISALSTICDKVSNVEVLNIDYHNCSSVSIASTLLVQSFREFPNLKHFSVQSHTIAFAEDLLVLLRASRGLQWWTGGFNFRFLDTLRYAMTSMAHFLPGLRRIDLYTWTRPAASLSDQEREALHDLATQLPSLEKICLFADWKEIVATYLVKRTDSSPNALTLIGPYIDEEYSWWVALDSLDWERDTILDMSFPFFT